MKFAWSERKNAELMSEGRPSFEDAVLAISNGNVLLEGDNPTHSGQRLFVIAIAGYPHVVPYEIRGDKYWLITVYPARKYKR